MKMRKFAALMLTLCMMLSLSISAFAASDTIASGTIPDSKIKWELDSHGWLTISGSGEAPVFQSADDQPWVEYREQITEVWYDDMSTLTISDLAYWFEGCTALTTAELPLAPVIGNHAFYGCDNLNTITMYYGETVLKSIGEDAFWREADAGDTLYIAYIIGYPEATVPFYTYDWAASNRNSRYFYDLYGVYPNADTANTAVNTASVSGIQKAPGISLTASTGIVGNCPSCGKYSLQGTYVSQSHTSRGHAEYYECYLCHYTKNLGTYVYKDHGSGSYGSWTCPDCGSHTWVLQSQQPASCTANGYAYYSCACGQVKSEMIYASGHNYSYGNWMQYSSAQHQRSKYCMNCGSSDYEYGAHSLSHGSWSRSSSTQHSRSVSCGVCGYSTTETGSHSYSYGSWSRYDETQHRRTKSCSACGDSSYEYADHVDTDGDGKCDTCGATVSLTIKWDAGTNGGTIDGKASFSETVKPNSKPTAPGSVPVKTGYTFKGWFTAKSGGSLYSTVTITSSTTFYAQFEANKYAVTWDLGTGQSETTEQTYGEKLVLPTEPTRKNAELLGWFTEPDGGTQVTANDVFAETADKTYYAHWEITEVFSVTVPVTLPLVVDESGEVHTGAAEIINGSTGEVVVSAVSISTKNGWQLVPFNTDMAHEKVDAKLLGFKINGVQTSKTGNAETFVLTAPWEIAENGKLPLSYDAIVSAVSKAVTEQEVLSVVFVLEWGGE